MKTNPVVPWSCRIVRVFHSPRSANERRGFGSRHIATCPACQEFFAGADALELALRREARTGLATTAPRPGLDDRIITAIARTERPAAPARRERVGRFVLAGAVAGAAAIAVLLVALQGPATETARPIAPTAVTRATPPADATTLAPTASLSELARPVTSALAQDPLQSEVESVYADARSAVQFLALNFLPSGALAQNESRPNGAGGG